MLNLQTRKNPQIIKRERSLGKFPRASQSSTTLSKCACLPQGTFCLCKPKAFPEFKKKELNSYLERELCASIDLGEAGKDVAQGQQDSGPVVPSNIWLLHGPAQVTGRMHVSMHKSFAWSWWACPLPSSGKGLMEIATVLLWHRNHIIHQPQELFISQSKKRLRVELIFNFKWINHLHWRQRQCFYSISSI